MEKVRDPKVDLETLQRDSIGKLTRIKHETFRKNQKKKILSEIFYKNNETEFIIIQN